MPVLNPSVVVTLDRVRRLKEDFRSLKSFEDATGKDALDPRTFATSVESLVADVVTLVTSDEPDFSKLMEADYRALTASDFSAYVWSLLLHEDPTVTLEQVREWITPVNFESVYSAVAELKQMQADLINPEGTRDEGGGDEGEAVPGGSISGPSDATTSDSPNPSSGS